MTSLNSKKATFTRSLLLDAACELAKTHEINELSFKKVSDKAEISQRTMFRYFESRDEFLDDLTAKIYSELDLPDIPNSVDALLDYVKELYQKLDEQPRQVLLLLSADLLPRIIKTTAKARLQSLQKLLASTFTKSSSDDIERTAANLRYVMSASSWRYYRISFEFDLTKSIECASLIVEHGIEYLRKQNQ